MKKKVLTNEYDSRDSRKTSRRRNHALRQCTILKRNTSSEEFCAFFTNVNELVLIQNPYDTLWCNFVKELGQNSNLRFRN